MAAMIVKGPLHWEQCSQVDLEDPFQQPGHRGLSLMSLPEPEVVLDLIGLDRVTYDGNQRIQRMTGIMAHRVEQAIQQGRGLLIIRLVVDMR